MKVNTGLAAKKTAQPIKSLKNKPSMSYLRDKDRELVKGVFNFHESKGGTLKFAFRKWKGDKIEQYSLLDGEVYTIPLGIAKHLNSSGRYKTHIFAVGPDGKTGQKIGKTTKRYDFQSLEFIDFDTANQDASSNILIVEEERPL